MINIGIIGCGRIAGHHCEAIKKIRGLKTVSVCDLDFTKAQELAKKYKAKAYKSYYEMLDEQQEINLVAIITPSGMHYEHAVDIIKKYKKNIIIEKPTFLKSEQVQEVYKLAEKNKIKLFPIFQNRYNKAVKRVKKSLGVGALGDIRTINATVRWCRPQRYYDMSKWRGTYSHDGGALTNQGIHYIDMLIFFASNITKVSCIAKTLGSKIEVEDTATAIFKLKNGGIGSLEITTAARPDDFEGSITLVCSKGMAKISGIASNELVIFSPKKSDCKKYSDDFKDLPGRGKVYGRGHHDSYIDIYKSLTKKVPYPIPSSECLKSVNLLNALYKSYENDGKWVKLDKIVKPRKLGRKNEKISNLYRS
jgi:UDP-N-acetyl-2-amino-2-deoxyglucuronate dehydrogenase